ncbi:hypothetical protein O181_109176 [Austropuccinia psidii MF-1]|uniref:Uncharacterized protein n=1 Tax=Austropuccinia psidii MF-1 TaxID=1389203 RepID=A0A9Q3JW78_9BASI|nr:hypothetical protein [Austropuccinia psidii MF-1]
MEFYPIKLLTNSAIQMRHVTLYPLQIFIHKPTLLTIPATMTNHHWSSMRIRMFQHCSIQTHSSPEGDRQGVSFTPFQYKQHIKKLKSTIAPKSLPNIPTSASVSECPQILLDQTFPADYSQLT